MFLPCALLAVLAQDRQPKPGWIWVEESRPRIPSRSMFFGSAVAATGDVDADGVRDLLVADILPPHWEREERTFQRHGLAWILSGRDGRVLSAILGPDGADHSGLSCAELGDLDGDGCGDYALGWFEGVPGQRGQAEIRSGRTGEPLWILHGPAACARFVGNAGDVDGDGRDDVALSGEWSVAGRSPAPLATIRSGVNGSVLRVIESRHGAERLVASPIGVGDVDGDERGDIAVLTRDVGYDCALLSVLSGSDARVARVFGVPLEEDPGWLPWSMCSLARVPPSRSGSAPRILVACLSSEAVVVSPIDGSVHSQHPRRDRIELGSGVACPGDLDGDGFDDVWVGVDNDDRSGAGCVHARSGKDDRVIYTFGDDYDSDQTRNAWHVGASIAAVGDIDGDGVCDGLAATDHTLSREPGMAFAFSGSTGRLIFGFTREDDTVRVSPANPSIAQQRAVPGGG